MREPLVSVIVPVYNVRNYMKESIQSLINQDYKNLEIILVDDGSTDDSGKMCDEFASGDPRIRVIHQENKGLSGARNTGISEMKGEMVTFLDPDDAFHPAMIRRMVETMLTEDAGIAVCRYVECRTRNTMVIPEEELQKKGETIVYSREDALRTLIEEKIFWYAWGKLYRSEYFENIRYPQGHVYEDVETTLKLFREAERIAFLDECLVMYRKWGGSITGSYQVSKIKDRERAYSIVYEYIKQNIPELFTEAHKQKYCKKILGIMYTIFIRTRSREEKALYREKIAEMEKDLDRSNCDRKLRVKYRLFHSSPALMKIADSSYVRSKIISRSISEKIRGGRY